MIYPVMLQFSALNVITAVVLVEVENGYEAMGKGQVIADKLRHQYDNLKSQALYVKAGLPEIIDPKEPVRITFEE